MKQRRVGLALVGIFVLVGLIAAVPSFGSQARIVRLSQVEGDVQIDRGGLGLEKAVLNMPVVEGTRIVADNDSTVELEFENGGTMRIVGPATVNFRELSLRSEGDKVTLVDLQPGIYYFDIKHKGDDDFQIGVSNDTLRVRKSAHFRVDAGTSETKVAVFKGELTLEGRDRDVAVKKNETLTLDASDAGRYFLAKGTDSLFSDSWDRERAEYRERYATAETWRYANNSYGSPYSYGFSDLNMYGNYFNAPGYGWLWRPSMYDMGWDPFSNGAWSYYPGQGWMFVSMYPWGWAPYRYGQWMFVPSYGWCWRPGTRYTYWNRVPVVRNPPPGTWHRPLPPGTNAGRTVFVNPAPPVSNGPVHTWRRPSATPASGMPGYVSGGGSTNTPITTMPPERQPGLWRHENGKKEVRGGQPNTTPTTTTIAPTPTPAPQENRGTWRRVTPPEQPRAQHPTAVPSTQTQTTPPPQRSVTPMPQRQAEPRHEPRPEPPPRNIERMPAPERGTWTRPEPSAPAPSRRGK